jgi:hypothetical protein
MINPNMRKLPSFPKDAVPIAALFALILFGWTMVAVFN